MQDGELVAAIVAGDPSGFADAYDRYAAPLYAYCSFMLPTPDDAASAVRDTFLIATSRLERLRDPNKLRPWLHAVARNDCLRRLSVAGVAPRLREAAGDGVPAAAELPASLRGEVLRACTDNSPAGRAERASVAHQAGAFGPTGFPKAFGSPASPWWRRHPRVVAAVATVVAVAVAGSLIVTLTGGGSHRARAFIVANGSGGSPSGAPGSAGSPSAPGRPGGTRQAQAAPTPGPPTPSVTVLGRVTSPASPTSHGTPQPSASPSATSASPSPSPSVSPSPSPSVSPSPSTSPSTGRGILTATPDKLVLTATSAKAATGSFVLSASYGPVSDYVIEIPPGLAGKLTVASAKGSLGAGGQVTVTVTVTSKVALTTHLTIDPGHVTVTVLFSIKH
jgi:hypothetical protein